jgi:imidazolonepropionase-like amidohydrolase
VDEPAFGRFLPPGSQPYLRDERVLGAIRARPEFPELKPDLERALKNVAILEAGGAPFGFGTDAGVSNRVIGFAEHRELQLLVDAGVSPARALQMATRDSAEVLGLADQLGQLAPGFRADMAVLRANPLEDIRNSLAIEAVWQDGVELAGPLD